MATTAIPRPSLSATDEASISQLDAACRDLTNYTKRPLLVLYYPPGARILEADVGDAYTALRAADLRVEQKLDSIDVLIDTYGGDPVAAYRFAQLIRDFSNEVFCLVPDHAYSAGTLLCFCAKEVRLGHYAGLSPIDITLVSAPGRKPREEVELASVDSFLDFAEKSRKRIEQLLQEVGSDGKTQVDCDLLVEMVKQVGALRVGKFFREKNVTGHYAEELLDSYMFCNRLDAVDRRNRVIRNFLFGAPAHEFHLDYHLCLEWGLAVSEMATAESDLAKAIVGHLEDLADSDVICPHLSRKERIPFFRFYSYTAPSNAGGDHQPAEGGNP